jgi:hypothetical protein
MSDKAAACPHCGAPNEAVTPGFEYRSRAEFLGLPLIHVAQGIDPATRRKRIAKGIIAIGDIAVGFIAIGGVAIGGLCLGGVALGVASLGGAAVGLYLALGGFAGGYAAVGGLAIGYYATGGMALGPHPIGPGVKDPEAVEFFRNLLGSGVRHLLPRG